MKETFKVRLLAEYPSEGREQAARVAFVKGGLDEIELGNVVRSLAIGLPTMGRQSQYRTYIEIEREEK